MDLENIELSGRGPVAVVQINHPPANTWNLATTRGFEKALDKLEHDPEIRVVIITGQGHKCFSAGFDLSDGDNADKISPLGRSLWTRLDRMEKPTIAAINGHAMGGGLELALCCHFRVMTDNPRTKLGLTELNVGILPGWGGTQRLARVVGKARALDMILFSRVLTPQEALESGVVDKIAPANQILDTALELADRLAQRPPVAVKWVLRAMSAREYEGLERGLEVEAEGSAACRVTEDRNEGFLAFLEKRQPVFTGR